MAIILFNGQPKQDPNVYYNGAVLPRDKVEFVPPLVDLTNNPSWIVVGGVVLPPDTIIHFDGEKVIANGKIIDGVEVFERISRKATEIEFEGVIRDKNSSGQNIFPQDAIANLYDTIFLTDTVQTLQNTYLNKLGIQEIVIRSISPATVRGSTNIPFRMKCFENVPGKSIIIP